MNDSWLHASTNAQSPLQAVQVARCGDVGTDGATSSPTLRPLCLGGPIGPVSSSVGGSATPRKGEPPSGTWLMPAPLLPRELHRTPVRRVRCPRRSGHAKCMRVELRGLCDKPPCFRTRWHVAPDRGDWVTGWSDSGRAGKLFRFHLAW